MENNNIEVDHLIFLTVGFVIIGLSVKLQKTSFYDIEPNHQFHLILQQYQDKNKCYNLNKQILKFNLYITSNIRIWNNRVSI